MPVPDFKFSLSNYNDKDYRFVTLGDDRVYYVADADGLYEALGYTNEVKRSGLLPDEFIWVEYRKQGGAKLPMCLQAKLIEYLCRNSNGFTEKYAAQIREWAGSCPDARAKEYKACAGGCLLHPESKQ